MQEVIGRMNPGEFIGFVAMSGGLVAGLLISLSAIVGGYWYGARRAEYETALKRELVAAGLSAEDIERIVNVTTGGAAAADLAKARLQHQQEIVKTRGF
jgi:CRP-like cAMP-binding protein